MTTTPAASTKPSFIHHDKITKGLEMIFGSTPESIKISDINVLEMLKLIPITPNSISLLSGIMGTGKTSFAKAFTKVFFKDDSLGMIKCDPDKTPHETLYGTDVASETSYTYDASGRIECTHEQFVFDPEALAFVTRPIKFANEISRSSKAVQDTLLGLFQEGEIEYRGKVFKTEKPFIALLDQNPLHLQSMGARELEPALVDRIDISINMPTTGIFDDLAIQANKDSTHVLELLLDYDTMKEVFEDVGKVRKPLAVKFLTVVISQSLRACKYRKDTASPIFIESIDCTTCEYNARVCSEVEAPVGHRHIESILKFAASRAWLNKREEIITEDIVAVIPFALAHRLKLRAKAYMKSDSTLSWIKEKALPQIVQEIPIYREMLKEYIECIKGSRDALLAVVYKSKNNLLYQQIIMKIAEDILNQSTRELDMLEEMLKNLKNPTRSDIKIALEAQGLKLIKMLSQLSDKDLNDIADSTEEILTRRELIKNAVNSEIGYKYNKINMLVKAISDVRERYKNIEKIAREAMKLTSIEERVTETDFMTKLLPTILKNINNQEIMDFGQKLIDSVTFAAGNASLEINRSNGQIYLILAADNQLDLYEARKMIGI